MSKYPAGHTVGAIYEGSSGNPYLDAMPDMLSPEQFAQAVASYPPIPYDMARMSPEERRGLLPSLASIYVPMPYQYAIYDTLYRAIATTYRTADVVESTRAINAYYCGRDTNYATQADSGSILGVPGCGKTATVHRCLSTMPQVIEHMEYQGQPCYCKQVLWLHVECPSDCSVKTLGFSIMAALDRAIGSKYLQSTQGLRSASASAIAVQTKILLTNHHVGLLVIDEIQNAVLTARKNHQEKPLLRYLVELTNETMTSIYFVGTPVAEELFVSQEHLKRRTRGIRLAPFRPDGAYLDFLNKIWPYQYTEQMAELTTSIGNKLYDCSGGIPAYIIKIFGESQAQALIQGRSYIDEKIIQRAVDLLAIKVPRTYAAGTHISDFEIGMVVPEPPLDQEEISRQYANKRGRKAAQRDDGDLLVAYNNGVGIEAHLSENGYLEADYRG
ncbi:ATP-binding protein [Flavonifractor sp. An112]|uniref:AAA family ATPase n=1 Tax=Flavonifractor sp. An112 TaxID=1965544 RepID=UPI00174E90A7|nr:ATP-binding protein [Flavonifractor sp. An112]